jgi:hypothetical protein
MGGSPSQSLRNPQKAHVPEPNPAPTRLHQTVLPSHRHICIRCGSCTLTGGRQTPQKNLTNQTPHSLLLRNIHPNRVQLRHLRERTPGTDESPSPLATSPGRINNPSHSPHRPRKPDLLEIPTQGKPPHSTLVRGTPRVPLKDPTHARETPHLGRPPLLTPRSGQRRDRQPRHNPPPPRCIRRINHHRRPQRRMVGTGATNRKGTTEVPRRDHAMDQTLPSDQRPPTQQRRPKTLARARKDRRPARQHPEEGDPLPISRLRDQRTPRTRPHHYDHLPTLLVAKHERMDRTIRERMCQMPTRQEPHEADKSTPLPHPHTDRCTPIPDRSNGPNHPTPNQQRV